MRKGKKKREKGGGGERGEVRELGRRGIRKQEK